MGRVEKLRKSGPTEVARMAQNMYEIVHRNPNRLTMLEKHVVEKLGVKVRHGPASIYYHKKSESVSVAWICHTKGSDEAMKLSMIAPPNDVKKRAVMREWIRNNSEDAIRTYKELTGKGVEVQQWWLEE